MSQYCVGKQLCDYYFCTTKNKCLWQISIRPKIKRRLKIAKNNPSRVEKLITIGHEGKCACCRSIEYLTFDHIIPISKKGSNGNENGQILCIRCNGLKGDRIISTEELKKEI